MEALIDILLNGNKAGYTLPELKTLNIDAEKLLECSTKEQQLFRAERLCSVEKTKQFAYRLFKTIDQGVILKLETHINNKFSELVGFPGDEQITIPVSLLAQINKTLAQIQQHNQELENQIKSLQLDRDLQKNIMSRLCGLAVEKMVRDKKEDEESKQIMEELIKFGEDVPEIKSVKNAAQVDDLFSEWVKPEAERIEEKIPPDLEDIRDQLFGPAPATSSSTLNRTLG